ncbi:MAG: PaaI family thioesterase [Mogibacterium sp.]|nr:PaaI family thioesterase [Mogibacterium sp.]
MANRVSQEEMERLVREELALRLQKGNDICSRILLEPQSCDAEAGTLTLRHTVSEEEANPFGTMHGGLIVWLMDSAMGILSRSSTGYKRTVTLDLHSTFLRPVRIGDEVRIEAKVLHAGRTTLHLTAQVYVGDKLCASGDANFFRTE